MFHKLLTVMLYTIILSLFAGPAKAEADFPAMVPRTVVEADGTTAIIYTNHKLKFTRGSQGPRPIRLAKRFTFSAGRDEWCGELAQDPATDFSAAAPSAADCKALVNSLNNENGFWTLQPSDVGGNDWVRVVSSGSCSFAVRYADAGSATSPMKIGTNDVRFYTTRYEVLERGGKLGLSGTVQCNNDEKMLLVTWGLIHS